MQIVPATHGHPRACSSQLSFPCSISPSCRPFTTIATLAPTTKPDAISWRATMSALHLPRKIARSIQFPTNMKNMAVLVKHKEVPPSTHLCSRSGLLKDHAWPKQRPAWPFFSRAKSRMPTTQTHLATTACSFLFLQLALTSSDYGQISISFAAKMASLSLDHASHRLFTSSLVSSFPATKVFKNPAFNSQFTTQSFSWKSFALLCSNYKTRIACMSSATSLAWLPF